MRLRYLCKGKPADDLLEVDSELVSRSLLSFGADSLDLWIVTFTTSGENQKEAKLLSAIACRFSEADVECLTLEDGASMYYERRLFPLLAQFERKLRAVLYLSVAMQDGNLHDDRIIDLERIDFGKLFERFFVDEGFVSAYKELLGGKNGRRYEKADLVAAIELLPELGQWDELFPNGDMPTVKSRHGSIRDLRNDVMHAHPMSEESFEIGSSDLTASLSELDEHLENLLAKPTNSGGFQKALDNVLATIQDGSTWRNLEGVSWGDLADLHWGDLNKVDGYLPAALADFGGNLSLLSELVDQTIPRASESLQLFSNSLATVTASAEQLADRYGELAQGARSLEEGESTAAEEGDCVNKRPD